MAVAFSQSELFFQLQMAAHSGGGHFAKGFSQLKLFVQLQMTAFYGEAIFMAIFGFSPRQLQCGQLNAALYLC